MSWRDSGRTYCNKKNESLFIPKVERKHKNIDVYQNRNTCTKIITLMKLCQSWVFTPPNSPFFVNILLMFEENLVGNLILWMTSFIALHCFSINNHGRELIVWSLLLFSWTTLHNAWFPSLMSLQILIIFYLLLLPSKIHHNIYIKFFLISII